MTSTDQPLGGHHYTDEEMHNDGVAHEHAEVDIRAILAFAAALAVVVAVSAGLVYGLWLVLEKQAEGRDPQVSPLARPPDQAPRGPRLLTNEPGNLRTFRQEETGKLESYGWMNQSAGIAHVPVDLAKKLVVEHGLPVRAGATADETLGTHAPAYGESSGGRRIPVKHAVPPAAPAGSEQQPAAAPQPAAGTQIKK
jgi:hypothetical protein